MVPSVVAVELPSAFAIAGENSPMTDNLIPVAADQVRSRIALSYLDQFGRWVSLGEGHRMGAETIHPPHPPLHLPVKPSRTAVELN